MITILLAIIIALISAFAWQNRAIYEDYLFDLQKVRQHEYYRLLSSGFLHADGAHLIFNLISFYSFASNLEYLYSPLYILTIFIGGILFGNLFSWFWHFKETNYRAVGASGGVLSIIYASIVLTEGGAVFIYFIPIPIPDTVYAVLYLLFTTVMLRSRRDNIGHAAHLGGAIFGTLLAFMFRPELIYTEYYMLFWLALPFLILKIMDYFSGKRF